MPSESGGQSARQTLAKRSLSKRKIETLGWHYTFPRILDPVESVCILALSIADYWFDLAIMDRAAKDWGRGWFSLLFAFLCISQILPTILKFPRNETKDVKESLKGGVVKVLCILCLGIIFPKVLVGPLGFLCVRNRGGMMTFKGLEAALQGVTQVPLQLSLVLIETFHDPENSVDWLLVGSVICSLSCIFGCFLTHPPRNDDFVVLFIPSHGYRASAIVGFMIFLGIIVRNLRYAIAIAGFRAWVLVPMALHLGVAIILYYRARPRGGTTLKNACYTGLLNMIGPLPINVGPPGSEEWKYSPELIWWDAMIGFAYLLPSFFFSRDIEIPWIDNGKEHNVQIFGVCETETETMCFSLETAMVGICINCVSLIPGMLMVMFLDYHPEAERSVKLKDGIEEASTKFALKWGKAPEIKEETLEDVAEESRDVADSNGSFTNGTQSNELAGTTSNPLDIQNWKQGDQLLPNIIETSEDGSLRSSWPDSSIRSTQNISTESSRSNGQGPSSLQQADSFKQSGSGSSQPFPIKEGAPMDPGLNGESSESIKKPKIFKLKPLPAVVQVKQNEEDSRDPQFAQIPLPGQYVDR